MTFPLCEMESRSGLEQWQWVAERWREPLEKKKMGNEITFRGEGLGRKRRHNEWHSDDED